MVVYADVLVLLNFYVDYFLILATEKLCRSSVKVFRRIIAAIVSSLFSLVIFLPEMGALVSLSVKIICAATTVVTAFGVKSVRDFLRRVFTFFAISYAFAGGMMALSMAFTVSGVVIQNSAVYCNISPLFLLGATTVFYLMIKLYVFVSKRRAISEQIISLRITYFNTSVKLKALVDTGNGLTDAISGAPVIVISKQLAEKIIGKQNTDLILSMNPDTNTVRGFRLIPYNAVGVKGILPAFRPDYVEVEGQRISQDVYIAISPTSLRDGIEAIVGPDLIDDKGGVERCFSA